MKTNFVLSFEGKTVLLFVGTVPGRQAHHRPMNQTSCLPVFVVCFLAFTRHCVCRPHLSKELEVAAIPRDPKQPGLKSHPHRRVMCDPGGGCSLFRPQVFLSVRICTYTLRDREKPKS